MKNKGITLLILIVILLLTANTFAWFIYNSNVNMSLEAKVKSWAIEFSENGQEIEEKVTFEIESIYPGMPEESKIINITNSGDTDAKIQYKITSITLFGESMIVGENCTSEEMDAYIDTLPFEIDINLEKDVIQALGDTSKAEIKFNWSFEDEVDIYDISEKDKLDTEFGQKAYEYNNLEQKEDEYSLKIDIKLIAKQNNV